VITREEIEARVSAAEKWLEARKSQRLTLVEHHHLSEVGARHMESLITIVRGMLEDVGDTEDITPPPSAGA